MKQKILIVFCIFGFGTTYSQQISADLISVSGQHDTNETHQLTWIIGETVTETISDSSVILTNGIFQSNLDISSINEQQIKVLEVYVYPNPTKDVLNITFENVVIPKLKYTLTDINGKLILNGNIKNKENQKKINFSNLDSGIYILTFTSKEKNQTFKIIKK
jgi:hypothetical protein